MKNEINVCQGKPFSVELESMLGSSNYGWCLMSMPEDVILCGQSNEPVAPGIAPVKQKYYFFAIGDCPDPSKVVLKFGLFHFSGICTTPISTKEYNVSIVPYNGIEKKVGAWTPVRKLNEEDRKVFQEATKGIIGMSYEALAVQSQLVSGTNYRFLCNATPAVFDPPTSQVIVSVYKPLAGQGEASITSIIPVEKGLLL